MKLRELIKDWYSEQLVNSDKLEEQYFELNEIKIDKLNTYSYQQVDYILNSRAWEFEDRCGNTIVTVYIEDIKEFKSGYKIEGVSTLIFDPSKLPNSEELITPCSDDKRVNTVYKILIEEVIPSYLLNKKPNRLVFNPVSSSRSRLVDIITNKVIQEYPQLTKKNNQLIYI